MKRWILTIENFNIQPLIYAETTEKAKQIFSTENVIDIQPYTDMSYLDLIQDMVNKSELLASYKIPQNRTKEWYKYRLKDGVVRFRLYKDNADDLYYDIAEYQFMSNSDLVYPITFTCSNPKDCYNLFFTQPLFCEVFSYRLYGEPKLAKPAELKGVKPSFLVDFIPHKCRCQCFIKGDDLWIKHRDFFSASHQPTPEDIGTPLPYRMNKYFGQDKSYLNKFVYPDCWSDIVLRNEAWIAFRNFKQAVLRERNLPPVQTMVKTFLQSEVLRKFGVYRLDNEWERFFEQIFKSYVKHVKQIS